jgi:hypothetical protein
MNKRDFDDLVQLLRDHIDDVIAEERKQIKVQVAREVQRQITDDLEMVLHAAARKIIRDNVTVSIKLRDSK